MTHTGNPINSNEVSQWKEIILNLFDKEEINKKIRATLTYIKENGISERDIQSMSRRKKGDVPVPAWAAKKIVEDLYPTDGKFHSMYDMHCGMGAQLSYFWKEKLLSLGCKNPENYIFINDYTDDKWNSTNNLNLEISLKRLGSSFGFKNIIKPNKMNPDFIIINPPFNKHEEIFNKSFDFLNDGGVLICIHPSTHFLNRKPTSKSSKIQRQLDIVSEYKTRLTLVDGNKIFDAGFFTPLSITRVEKVLDEKIEVVYSHIDSTNKEVKVYDKLDDIFIHGNDIVLKIKDKIFSKMKSSIEGNLYRKGKIGEYYLTINKMVGNIPRNEGKMNPDFYCLVNKKYENSVDDLISNIAKEKWEQKGGSQFNQISLNTYDECVNTHHNLMTKFSRFALSIYKIASYMDCGELLSVPFLDPSKKYSDSELYEYFRLESEERNFIDTYIQNWYEKDGKSN
jgi:hypothetical protein